MKRTLVDTDPQSNIKVHLRDQIAAIESRKMSCGNSSAKIELAQIEELSQGAQYCSDVAPHSCETESDVLKPSGNETEDFEAECARAFKKIERVAVAREQASALLRKRLVRESFSIEATEVALGRALACGLIDDLRYADVLIRSRLSQGRGVQGIEAELANLNIDSCTIAGWPDEYLENEDDELVRALDLLNRKPPRAKNKRDAAFRKLVQKGFGSSIAASAARIWSEDQAIEANLSFF